jgi:hypothetical protein
VLDRSGSFARRPDGSLPPHSAAGAAETRWSIAVHTIHAMTAALDQTIRFGLTLFPLDPEGADGHDCSNLDTWLRQYLPPETRHPICQPAELLVSPTENSAELIAGAITVSGTGLCNWTPIGAGLAAAFDELTAIRDGQRDQFALLITDGRDNCDFRDGYTTTSLPTADQMKAAGIRTFVVGFDGSGEDLDPDHLNDLACAGGTAPDFARNCQLVNGGYRAVASPSPARLYHLATEAESLRSSLAGIGDQVGCRPVD